MPESQRCAVLIDGSALFFAVRNHFDGQGLDYQALLQLLGREFGRGSGSPIVGPDAKLLVLPPNPGSVWQFWSPSVPQNEGQLRFLTYVETNLGIPVRRFSLLDSIALDPQTALSTIGESPRLKERLTRFDASIAFTMGALAATHQIILITDSFALAEPMVRAARARWERFGEMPQPPNVLAFFGRAMDSRWSGLFRRGQLGDPAQGVVRHLDFDEHIEGLFNQRREPTRTWWTDDAALGRSGGAIGRK
jgi:hypothetical protein